MYGRPETIISWGPIHDLCSGEVLTLLQNRCTELTSSGSNVDPRELGNYLRTVLLLGVNRLHFLVPGLYSQVERLLSHWGSTQSYDLCHLCTALLPRDPGDDLFPLHQLARGTTGPALLPSTLALTLNSHINPLPSRAAVQHAIAAFRSLSAPNRWDVCRNAFAVFVRFIDVKLRAWDKSLAVMPIDILSVDTAIDGAAAIITLLDQVINTLGDAEVRRPAQQLYLDVALHPPEGTVSPSPLLKQTVMSLSNTISWPQRQPLQVANLLDVLSRADFTSWWSAHIGVATRTALHALSRLPDAKSDSLQSFLEGFSLTSCKFISWYLQSRYESGNEALEGSRANLLARSFDGTPSTWHSILVLSGRIDDWTTFSVAADLSIHLCQLHRSGVDICPLLDELFTAGDSRRSAQNLLRIKHEFLSENMAIHLKEISPDWWEDIKAVLPVDTDADTIRFITEVDAAGPCRACPARLQFKAQTPVEGDLDELPPEAPEPVAETRSDRGRGPTTHAPTTRGQFSTVSTALHRILGRHGTQRDVEADPGDH
jgi:hypothetical protein